MVKFIRISSFCVLTFTNLCYLQFYPLNKRYLKGYIFAYIINRIFFDNYVFNVISFKLLTLTNSALGQHFAFSMCEKPTRLHQRAHITASETTIEKIK